MSIRIRQLALRLRVQKARLFGAAVRSNVTIGKNCEFKLGIHNGNKGSIFLGERSEVERNCIFHAYGGEIEIGNGVFIGPGTTLYGHGGITIGDRSLIAMNCCILSSEHTVPSRTKFIRDMPDKRLSTRLGTDVWLGASVVVLGGVSIGNGCVVGAGAVVTKDLPDYSISLGVPAVVRSYRGEEND
jgi:acetyltransferase-like isoleucine patch superfamily enzyme